MKGVSCCGGFEGLLDAAGQRGLSVIAAEEAGQRGFRLQARACDAADIPMLAKRLAGEREGLSNVSLAAQTGMRYCPFCGTELDQLIGRRVEEFGVLLEKHRQLAL
ncbi:MAG: hypothetical protein JXB05_20535 [Myxococcaceae bacterium]|nr:hypothetical protein [Myxococcaceae bacterium]